MKQALAHVFIMSLHKYFTIEKCQSFLQLTILPTKVSLLTDEELRLTNRCAERSVNPRALIHNRVNYNGYTWQRRDRKWSNASFCALLKTFEEQIFFVACGLQWQLIQFPPVALFLLHTHLWYLIHLSCTLNHPQ